MKVLLLSVYHPDLLRGGAQRVAYELFQGLKAMDGVEPVLLASIDPSFTAFYKSGAQITGFDGRDNEFLFLSQNYDYVWHRCNAPLLLEAYAEFLRLTRPDVVHFHHFLLFGLELLSLTRRVLPQARIVFTLHEFMTICAADGHMLRRTDNALCHRASSVRCHQCLPDHPPEHFFMRTLWVKRHLRVVDAFTAPSRFMIEHFVAWGLDRAQITHVTNGQRDYNIGLMPEGDRPRRNRFGFFGQLVDVKGVWLLLEAVQLLRADGFTDFIVEINGDNLRFASPARRADIEGFLAAENRLPLAERRVFFNGSYDVEKLPALMARIDWCVVPSVWWEIFGLVISEAMMFRRPVICAGIGGPGERVLDGVDGLHFQVGDARSLAATMRRACLDSGLWSSLSASMAAPPDRSAMVDGFMSIYKGAAPGMQPASISAAA